MFLPDTALLVPGAGGRADPGAGLRGAALAALRAVDVRRRVLVVAPARRARFLPDPVGLGLGAAGLDTAGLDTAGLGSATAAPPAHRADVPASTALVLLRAAGVRAPVDVTELDRADPGSTPVLRTPAPRTPYLDELDLLVVVGSLSARHGPDAPLADDPRAPDADAALLGGLGSGPAALADALDALGPDGAADLAISGAGPWRVALRFVAEGSVEATHPHAEILAGAQHAVAAWAVTTTSTAPEEPR